MALSERLAVAADSLNEARAQRFAADHALAYSACEQPKFLAKACAHDYVLYYGGHSVQLYQLGKKAPGPVSASFLQGKVKHRQQFGGGQGQMIAKAVGLKSGVRPMVLDATAGLGGDAFVLASLGCELTLLEASPWVAELLEAALIEAQGADELPDIQTVAQRMRLYKTDAITWLKQHDESVADVIYLDPMYPHRDKSALVKKEMRAFHELLGVADNNAELLAQALNKARYRVVVKRPRKGEAIAGPAPNLVLEGKSSRYDIYTIASMTALKA